MTMYVFVAANYTLPCFYVFSTTSPESGLLSGCQLYLHSDGNISRDFILHGKNVDQFSIVAISPAVIAGARID